MKKYIFYSLIVFIFFESISNSGLEFFEKEKHDKLFKRILQNVCNPESCPPFQGYCRDDDCVCLEGYITKKDPMNHKFCNYRQKSVIISLLLEAFGLIGFGHVYAGRIFYGVLKLVAFYLLICCGSQFVITLMKENSDTDTAYYIKLMLSTAILGLPVLWHFIDLYKWGTNQYLDGNEQSMESW
jgi:TM2 domain-containing membrane protein YozV